MEKLNNLEDNTQNDSLLKEKRACPDKVDDIYINDTLIVDNCIKSCLICSDPSNKECQKCNKFFCDTHYNLVIIKEKCGVNTCNSSASIRCLECSKNVSTFFCDAHTLLMHKQNHKTCCIEHTYDYADEELMKFYENDLYILRINKIKAIMNYIYKKPYVLVSSSTGSGKTIFSDQLKFYLEKIKHGCKIIKINCLLIDEVSTLFQELKKANESHEKNDVVEVFFIIDEIQQLSENENKDLYIAIKKLTDNQSFNSKFYFFLFGIYLNELKKSKKKPDVANLTPIEIEDKCYEFLAFTKDEFFDYFQLIFKEFDLSMSLEEKLESVKEDLKKNFETYDKYLGGHPLMVKCFFEYIKSLGDFSKDKFISHLCSVDFISYLYKASKNFTIINKMRDVTPYRKYSLELVELSEKKELQESVDYFLDTEKYDNLFNLHKLGIISKIKKDDINNNNGFRFASLLFGKCFTPFILGSLKDDIQIKDPDILIKKICDAINGEPNNTFLYNSYMSTISNKKKFFEANWKYHFLLAYYQLLPEKNVNGKYIVLNEVSDIVTNSPDFKGRADTFINSVINTVFEFCIEKPLEHALRKDYEINEKIIKKFSLSDETSNYVFKPDIKYRVIYFTDCQHVFSSDSIFDSKLDSTDYSNNPDANLINSMSNNVKLQLPNDLKSIKDRVAQEVINIVYQVDSIKKKINLSIVKS